MNEFDDPALRNTLQQLGGYAPDETAAYNLVTQRVRAVKRRRVAVASGGLLAICLGAVTLTSLRGEGNQTLTPATVDAPDLRLDDADSVVTSTTDDPATTATSAPETSAADSTTSVAETTPTVAPTTASTTAATVAPPVVTTPVVTSSAATIPAGSSGTAAAGTTPSSATASTNPPSSTPEVQTFSALHGSITVALRDGRLEITGYTAEPGYEYRVERSDRDRIRVRFRNGENRSQIDVTVAAGRIAGTTSEETSTAPSSSTPGPTEPPSTFPGAPPTTDDHDGGGGAGSGSGSGSDGG